MKDVQMNCVFFAVEKALNDVELNEGLWGALLPKRSQVSRVRIPDYGRRGRNDVGKERFLEREELTVTG